MAHDFCGGRHSEVIAQLTWAHLVGGFSPPTPLKNDGVKVNWDHDIPNIWKNKVDVPNHQPVTFFFKWRVRSNDIAPVNHPS